MKKILIEETNNGWDVFNEGFTKNNGPYCYKATEILTMLEVIGELINDRKVRVEEK